MNQRFKNEIKANANVFNITLTQKPKTIFFLGPANFIFIILFQMQGFFIQSYRIYLLLTALWKGIMQEPLPFIEVPESTKQEGTDRKNI
jgi:hypothetical protein